VRESFLAPNDAGICSRDHGRLETDAMRQATLRVMTIGILLGSAALIPCARGAEASGVRLTVYNQNFALVKDRRELPDALRSGLNVVRFRDVASTIDATSVHFRSLTDPGATVVEQNYEFDLVNADKLLQKYIDRPITAYTAERPYEGILMSFDQRRLVLAADREKGPIFMVERGENIKRIAFSSLPDGLLTRPTLVWELATDQAARHTVEVSYIANNIRWRADYNLVLSPDDARVDLSGWVTVENHTGTAYKEAAVKLMAGDTRIDYALHHYGFGQEYYKLLTRLAPTTQKGDDPSRVFGEYRMYDLPETTTVNNNQIKQVEILRAAGVPVTKTYLYDGSKLHWFRYGQYWDPNYGRDENKKVNVIVEFENRADRNLGIALPKGKCRVYKKDTDGALEFIGEDTIDHTSRDEKVALYIGDAFDIVGERKQTDFKKITDRVYEEAFEIKLRNHKEEAVTVKVLEKLYRTSEWTVREKNHDFEKVDSRTIVFPVRIEPDSERVVTYRVRYTW